MLISYLNKRKIILYKVCITIPYSCLILNKLNVHSYDMMMILANNAIKILKIIIRNHNRILIQTFIHFLHFYTEQIRLVPVRSGPVRSGLFTFFGGLVISINLMFFLHCSVLFCCRAFTRWRTKIMINKGTCQVMYKIHSHIKCFIQMLLHVYKGQRCESFVRFFYFFVVAKEKNHERATRSNKHWCLQTFRAIKTHTVWISGWL